MNLFDEYHKELDTKSEVYLRIKARPGAAQTIAREILHGEEGETIKIDVAAAPEKGKANFELIKFISNEFSLPKKNIKIISGASDKIKIIKINKYDKHG